MATPIIGTAQTDATRARVWAVRHGATAEFADLAALYWSLAPGRGGARPDVAFAQSAKETGYGHFGGVIDASYHNPCGLKTKDGGGNYDPHAHQRFPDWKTGVTAHLDHLALYAGAAGYPRPGTPDPRHFVQPGIAKTVEELGGRWAPSTTYGHEILALVRDMTAGAPSPTPVPSAAPSFVNRADWGARSPSNITPLKPTGIRVHYSGSGADEQADHAHCAARVKGIQNYHMNTQKWADIAYSFLVCRHGVVFEGRGWDRRTAANGTNACNGCCLAVCFLGDDTPNRDDVTPAGRNALAWVLRQAAKRGASQVGGHRDCLATSCPGDELYAYVRSGAWETAPAPTPSPQPAPPPAGKHSHGFIEIRRGAQDPVQGRALVKDAQAHLNVRGARDNSGQMLVVDGDFGLKTQEAVANFQRMRGLRVNGIVDVKSTWPALHA